MLAVRPFRSVHGLALVGEGSIKDSPFACMLHLISGRPCIHRVLVQGPHVVRLSLLDICPSIVDRSLG